MNQMNVGAALGGGQSGSSAITTMRQVRLAGDASPFVWRGLLPILGLAGVVWFGLGPFAANDVQQTVAREVSAQLQQQGHGWAKVLVSGQEVFLSGVPPRAGAGDEALTAARAATCTTWAGPQVCAVAVLGEFAAPMSAAPGLPSLAAPAVGSGSAAATSATPSAASSPAAAALPAAVACEAELARLLQGSRIEFASGGSTIDARSHALLDALARAARGCPGRILVEGHTDNVGAPEANRRLSDARAAGVRDALVRRGVPAVQLEALGLGDSRPLADNGSEAGRAANRRIDFKALP